MSEPLREVLRVASYPALFVAHVALGWALLRAGYETLALLAPVALLSAVLAALERLIPWEPAWLAQRGDVPTDIAHTIATVILSPLVTAATLAAMPELDHGWLAAIAWLPLETFVVLALGDLAPYVYHRASHEWSGALFRIHAVHHSPTRLYWLNAFRVHPINLAANVALRAAPAVLLGASSEAIALAALASAFGNVFSHANVDARTGWIDWLVSTPAAHRLHHHVDAKTSQSNYGGTLLVWDLLLGTRRAPREIRDGDIGVGDAAPREAWLAQLLAPLGIRCCM